MVKSVLVSHVTHPPELVLVSCSLLDGMPVHQGYLLAIHQASLGIGWYLFILLGEEGHCENKVSCPSTQHNDLASS